MVMQKQKRVPAAHKKRHGQHHNKGKHYHRVYLPYLPAVLILILSLLLSGLRITSQGSGVLAYATSMTVSGLHSATNTQRSDHSVGSLRINSKLNSAAQAKAEDMVKRDYWSHNTPDGEEPWVFIDATGYAYSKAGENLAYGFGTSASAVAGWMNSPSHKSNLLDPAYKEVGFGFANSSDYQGNGPQTVVVAMYAKPEVLSSSSPAPAAPTQEQSKPPQSTIPKAEQEKSVPSSIQPEDKAPAADEEKEQASPVTSSEPVSSVDNSQTITQAETLIGSEAPWVMLSIGLVTGVAATILLANHALRLRHIIRKSERFIQHHPVLDVTLISLLILGLVLSRSVGHIL